MQRGTIVFSKAGRDKGSFFVVTSIEGKVIFLVDGKSRKLLNPKKKNIKHVANTSMYLPLSDKTTDSEIRRFINVQAGYDRN